MSTSRASPPMPQAPRRKAGCWGSTGTPDCAAPSRSRAPMSSSAVRSAVSRPSWHRPAIWWFWATPARRSGTRCMRPASSCAARSRAWAPTARKSPSAPASARSWPVCCTRPATPGSIRRRSSSTAPPPPPPHSPSPHPAPNWHDHPPATQPSPDSTARTPPRFSASFDPAALAEIRRAAATGIYDIRGAGTKRRLPHFDDLLFLGASISRYPLEGYREKCATDVLLGARFARKPLHLQIPVTIAGMSFGALSANAKEALGRGASIAGTSTTTGDGGMTPEERGQSKTLVYQYLPSRYGVNPDHLRQADAIEIVGGQGAKPGGGGMLLGQKISARVARMGCLPEGIDQRSACLHPDWTGPDDLEIKIHELREITDWEKPIYVKLGATRPYYDVALAVKAGADVVVLDGMQGGTAATQEVFIEHVGIPILAAIRPAVQALQDLGMHRKVQLIVSGGIRNGADVAKALALGADAVAIGTAAFVALRHNESRQPGSTAGAYDDWHEGKDPAGITTQAPALAARLDPVLAGRRLANYLAVLTMEAQIIARACGKSHLHHLEPEDLAALTLEAAAMTQIPLAGTAWYPGK